MQA
ncbi:putative membrane protein, partial [Chlamydia psittaci 03DC29]|jgi:hypothetical protein